MSNKNDGYIYKDDDMEDDNITVSDGSEEDNVVKLLARTIGGILLAVLLIIMLFRSIYTVDEQHNAVVTQFGQVVRVDTAGIYLKFPWQSVKKIDITTHGTGIGYTVSDKGQNIVDTENGIMITSDFNLLNIDFYLEYRVSDPIAYMYNTSDPEAIMINIALANIRTVVSNYTVDEAMTTGKAAIQADVKEALVNALAEQKIGLTAVNITVQDSEPPTEEIKQAFKSVENAKQSADTAMNKALEYQNQQIPNAEADADAIIQSATAYKEARIAEAEGQVARFTKMYDEYQNYPLITKRRLFYEKMNDVLPDIKVIITDGSTQTVLPLDSFTY
jgi:membrane protease subunit HflK